MQKFCYLISGKVVLRCFGLWVWNGHRCFILIIGEVLRVARRSSHHHRQRKIQSARVPLPAVIHWPGAGRHSREDLQLDHEVRHRHQKGLVRQQRHVRRLHHVPRHCRPHAEGDHRLGAQHHEDQDHRATRKKVLRLDRWLHLGLTVYLSNHVDHQGWIWRVWPKHCPQKVLLN